MKKLKIATLITILIFLFTDCSKEQGSNYGFFAWMDAYIAVESNTNNAIAITLFFDDPPFKKEDVTSVNFENIQEYVTISNFGIDDSAPKNGDYYTYIITLEYIPEVTGIYDTSGIIIELSNNTRINYPVGSWVFDINGQAAGIVDSWNSPVASKNAVEFPFNYSVNNGNINKIHYGKDIFISNVDGIIEKGTIDIKDSYTSPVVYIKTKIEVYVNGIQKIDYGKGCYCGAFGFSEDGLISSKKHNSIN